MKRAPEYDCWAKMIQRCTNPNATGYKYWGGRGIAVCDRWRRSYANFLADVGPRPTPQYSIDRINNDLNYQPGNVRWVMRTAQNRNRSITVLLTWNERTMTLEEWSKVTGFSYKTLQMRIRRQWPLHRVLTEPLGLGRFTRQPHKPVPV
jgi:hypothetical protein